MLTVLLGSGDLHATRPPAQYGGSKQLDIDRLEKVLGQKFSTSFPSHRFDIDYFFKGDLSRFHVGDEAVYATCPYVVGPMVAFTVGAGKDSDSFTPAIDVSVDFDATGQISRVHFMQLDLEASRLPPSHEVPVRGDEESAEAYLRRSKAFWEDVVGKSPEPALTKAQVEIAMRVISACIEQGAAQVAPR